MNPNPIAYSPGPDPQYQARQDSEHLNLLSIFYYVATGFMALSSLGGIFYMFMGLAFVSAASGTTSTIPVTPNTFPGAPPMTPGATPHGAPPPPEFGWMFVGIGAFMTIAFLIMAILTFLAGRGIAKRERKTLIQIVAALLCLNVPLGTALGVFTFILLSRPSVAALFDAPRSS